MSQERSPRVLVVDDDPSIRNFIRDALVLEGYDVLTAPDGAAALELVQCHQAARPDVILLDVRMPVMDGPEFVRRYRQTPDPGAALLLLTAVDDPVGYMEALQVDGFLAKPFDVGFLLELIERSLGQQAAVAGR